MPVCPACVRGAGVAATTVHTSVHDLSSTLVGHAGWRLTTSTVETVEQPQFVVFWRCSVRPRARYCTLPIDGPAHTATATANDFVCASDCTRCDVLERVDTPGTGCSLPHQLSGRSDTVWAQSQGLGPRDDTIKTCAAVGAAADTGAKAAQPHQLRVAHAPPTQAPFKSASARQSRCACPKASSSTVEFSRLTLIGRLP